MYFKKLKSFLAIFIVATFIMPQSIYAYSNYIIAGGENIGLQINNNGIIVAGFYKVDNEFIGKNANLNKGDVIKSVDNNKVSNDYELTVAGKEIPFEFTFTTEEQYPDNPNINFGLNVYDCDSTLICATTVAVTKHAETIPESPVELPYAEYSLSGTSCEWNFTKEDSDIIVVNSREELEKYIVCDGECTAPSVDFEKHSLVIAHGGCTNGIHQIGVSKFVKFADEKYGLYIDIVMGWTDAPELWTYAIITDKLNGQNSVELFVDIESM